jgi:hypothetical protein
LHLLSFRKGWESERLAEYLLSRLAFVARPTTIADDVGLDFYCTLFQDIQSGSNALLQPKLAVAVQVKSAGPTAFDLSDKCDFLLGLELPYLIGVSDRSKHTLALHSGCYLPVTFSKHGRPSSLKALLASTLEGTFPGPPGAPEPEAVPFPLITTLSTSDSEADLHSQREHLIAHCSAVARHVRGFLAADYLFEYDRTEIVYAGPSSAQTFRRRLLGRLSEARINLEWLEAHGSPPPRSEVEALEMLIRELAQRHELPLTLSDYDQIA